MRIWVCRSTSPRDKPINSRCDLSVLPSSVKIASELVGDALISFVIEGEATKGWLDDASFSSRRMSVDESSFK